MRNLHFEDLLVALLDVLKANSEVLSWLLRFAT
jgi:hypothetical protein